MDERYLYWVAILGLFGLGVYLVWPKPAPPGPTGPPQPKYEKVEYTVI
jgi:hypothetical protein